MTISIDPGIRDIWRIVQSLVSVVNKWNASGQVTLRPGQTTTTVDKLIAAGAVNVSRDDEIMLSPRTAAAAATIATVYVSAVTQGGFTLTHAAAAAGCTFGWASR